MANIFELLKTAKLAHDFSTKKDYAAGRELVEKGRKMLKDNNIDENDILTVVNIGMKYFKKINK